MQPSKNSVTFFARGNCQRSVIPPDSLIGVVALPSECYKAGDLVVFSHKQGYVCHRILYTNRADNLRWFYVKADYAWWADAWIPEYRLAGKVTEVNGESITCFRLRAKNHFWLWASRVTDLIGRLRRKII